MIVPRRNERNSAFVSKLVGVGMNAFVDLRRDRKATGQQEDKNERATGGNAK